MSRYVINLGWEDVPHLTEEDKKEILAGILPYEHDAVIHGRPQLGSGAIYPVPESDITVQPFRIPDNWPRAYGLDVGWKKTAAVFGAYCKKEDCWYLYSEYYRGYAEPSVHADNIKAKGTWIPGVVDCHSDRRGEAGSTELSILYDRFGLNLSLAKNGPHTLEPSLLEVYQRLSSGRLKVFANLSNWFSEFRTYRKDMDGRVVKQEDHLMDATRYLVMMGEQVMEVPPLEEDEVKPHPAVQGRSNLTGY